MQSNSKEEENIRGVAQLASASGLGPEGPVFESQYPDFKEEAVFCFLLLILSQRRRKLKTSLGIPRMSVDHLQHLERDSRIVFPECPLQGSSQRHPGPEELQEKLPDGLSVLSLHIRNCLEFFRKFFYGSFRNPMD